MVFELIRNPVPVLSVGWRLTLLGNIWPGTGEIPVQFGPLLNIRLGVRADRLSRAFGLADTAIDTLVRMDDEHIFAFIEAIDRANFHAVHILTLDAGLGYDIGHCDLPARF